MTELLPAPNSVSSRADTSADSELRSSQPPELRAEDVCVARLRRRDRDDDREDGDGSAEAIDECSPAGEHRDVPFWRS